MSDATRLNKNSTKECPLVWAEERSLLVRVRGMVGWGRGDREEWPMRKGGVTGWKGNPGQGRLFCVLCFVNEKNWCLLGLDGHDVAFANS